MAHILMRYRLNDAVMGRNKVAILLRYHQASHIIKQIAFKRDYMAGLSEA